MLHEIEVESPLGPLRVLGREGAITALYTPEHRAPPAWRGADGEGVPVLVEARRQLAQYFAGERRVFTLPLAMEGTAFQQAVWAALTEIPLGTTVTYGQLAVRLGRPAAARAVGAANGGNPVSIVVPCHRVIGGGGALTGYAGGLAAKRWLLDHETAVLEKGAGGAIRDRTRLSP
ncbi:methylated-DNA--[protein]-cysteine S-methyltransferase [Chondromyces apiculatus]|uniref:Methylated-DNA--protein-cysteine methyltransferase n=1 Tax=Chondromyces apiculatus DSM 436 TaxID=1192034 RepID=A0A017SXR0_9BACT|nr:methylated-DNA--[protein]-cysteine S-methyltransferase [Chondromyces apiculatus]EYF01051.1 Methylated-DNA--protein-cysteine methyltransferase [Chondromyces apiculatus DSM 436]